MELDQGKPDEYSPMLNSTNFYLSNEYQAKFLETKFLESFVQFSHFKFYPFMCFNTPLYFEPWKFDSRKKSRQVAPNKLHRYSGQFFALAKARKTTGLCSFFYMNTKAAVVPYANFIHRRLDPLDFRSLDD